MHSYNLQSLGYFTFYIVDEGVLADAGTDIDDVDQEKLIEDGSPKTKVVTDIDERVTEEVGFCCCYREGGGLNFITKMCTSPFFCVCNCDIFV